MNFGFEEPAFESFEDQLEHYKELNDDVNVMHTYQKLLREDSLNVNYHFEYLEAGKTLYPNLIGGSHWDTENQYIVLVYLKKFGQRHDSLLGVGSGSSLNIRN